MVGAGVGAGIMAVPSLADGVGFPAFLLVLLVAYGAAALIHLMLVEIALRTGQPLQIIELMRLWVLDGPRRRPLLWLVFGLLALAFVAALAAYTAAAADILASASGLPLLVAQLLVYALAAGVVLFGLRAVGLFELAGVAALVGCVLALLIGSAVVELEPDLAVRGGPTDLLGLYAMVMYGYYAFFSVPQVVRGLAPDGRMAARAVGAGLALNGALIGAVAFVALSVPGEVTEVAITGIADQLGPWAGGVGAIFTVVALLTTYWAVSLALAEIIAERSGLGFRRSWLAATLPSLLLLVSGAMGFLGWLQLAAGLTALVVALVMVPMYVNARTHGPVHDPSWSLGPWGGRALLGLALLAAVLMAAGSLLEA